MFSVVGGFRKFLSNKNTVTIICVVLGVLVLFFGYRFRVTKATDPVRIPYALKTIEKKSKITSDLVGYTNVPRSLITSSKTILTNAKNVIDKYASYATPIPANSYFYNDIIMTEEEMPDYAFMNMADGYTVYSLSVNMNKTYANKIYPNTYIDLYAKVDDSESGLIMFACLIESIKVKAVKDSRGNSLLEGGLKTGDPAAMLFEVPNDLFYLLKISEWVSGVEIIPVPRNAAYTAKQGETTVDNKTISDYILSNAIDISE